MKRFFALLLLLVMTVALVGCGDSAPQAAKEYSIYYYTSTGGTVAPRGEVPEGAKPHKDLMFTDLFGNETPATEASPYVMDLNGKTYTFLPHAIHENPLSAHSNKTLSACGFAEIYISDSFFLRLRQSTQEILAFTPLTIARGYDFTEAAGRERADRLLVALYGDSAAQTYAHVESEDFAGAYKTTYTRFLCGVATDDTITISLTGDLEIYEISAKHLHYFDFIADHLQESWITAAREHLLSALGEGYSLVNETLTIDAYGTLYLTAQAYLVDESGAPAPTATTYWINVTQ